MANEQNLNHKLTVSELRKGGQNSAKSRREKKTVQKILSDLLNSEIKDMPQFAKLASKMGVESDKSVKDIFTMVCLLNSVKNGNLGDLERLTKLLGEQVEETGANEQKQVNAHNDLIEALKSRRNNED
jgi:ribosome-binding factor A